MNSVFKNEMKYLLYCIFRSRKNQAGNTPAGVDEQPVFVVSHNGLSAAVSRINTKDPVPDITRILAYKRVVEYLHDVRTVIPMRYGCLFHEESQITQHLEKQRNNYEKLVQQIDDCTEMGIRLIIDDCRPPWCDSATKRPHPCADLEDEVGELQPPKTGLGQGLSIEGLKNREMKLETRNSKLKTSGKAYLAARKAHYAQEEHITEAQNEIIEQFRAAFAGLFVKCKVETAAIANYQLSIANRQSTINNQLISLYFLVPRKSTGKFREVFRRLSRTESAKLLLSGPWPPYNFVLPDHPYDLPCFPGNAETERIPS